MIDFLTSHAKEIFSVATPFILWFINNRFQPRAKLVQQTRHGFTFLIQSPLLDAQGNELAPTQTVNTASVSIFNAGRSPATKVEVVFNWKPQHLNIWPSRHYEEKLSPDGRFSIFFDSLPAKDTMGFELLAVNAALPEMVTVRSEQSVATKMRLVPQPILPRWKVVIILWLIGCGVAVNVYVVSLLIQLLAAH